jgi:hypothetical protein
MRTEQPVFATILKQVCSIIVMHAVSSAASAYACAECLRKLICSYLYVQIVHAQAGSSYATASADC